VGLVYSVSLKPHDSLFLSPFPSYGFSRFLLPEEGVSTPFAERPFPLFPIDKPSTSLFLGPYDRTFPLGRSYSLGRLPKKVFPPANPGFLLFFSRTLFPWIALFSPRLSAGTFLLSLPWTAFFSRRTLPDNCHRPPTPCPSHPRPARRFLVTVSPSAGLIRFFQIVQSRPPLRAGPLS